MKVIVEGPDGVGKTTLVRALADKYNCDILSMTELGSKYYSDYLDKSKLDNIISDRSFISEIVYSSVFNRTCKLSRHAIMELFDEYFIRNWKIVILDASTEKILERINCRGGEDQTKIDNIDKLRSAYRTIATVFNIKVIDTENNSYGDIFNFLEEKYE